MVVAALAVPVGYVLGVAATSTLATSVATGILWAGTAAASLLLQSTQQVKQDLSTKLTAHSGGAVGLSGLFGEKESAGSLIFAGLWGRDEKTQNTFLVRVYCMSDLECTQLAPMPGDANKSPVFLSGDSAYLDLTKQGYTASDTASSGTSMGYVVPDKNHDGHEYLWVKFLMGDQVAADTYLTQKFPYNATTSPRGWRPSMIGRGRALMIVTQRFTVKEANGALEVVASFRGAKCYDWRKDSTNGGSGTHRWNDPTTYEYTANPPVILYNIMRGIIRFGTVLYGGLNWPARRFDNATWTAVANYADENIALKAGGTVRRFRMGAEINFAEPPINVVDRILSSFSGRLVESGGIYKLASGAVGAAVYSFSDDDIVITESLSGRAFLTRDEICNTIAGSYCEPKNGGEMKAYKKKTRAAYVTSDGGEIRSKPMDFPYVRENTQAQRLALTALNDNRRFASKVVCLPPVARKLEPNDCLNWSASARFGYTNKKWILGDTTLLESGWVVAAIREADPTDADWNPANDEDAYTVGLFGDIVPAQQIFTCNITDIVLKDASDHSRRPGIKISRALDADDLVDAHALAYRVRLKGTSDIIVKNRDDNFFDDVAPGSDPATIRFSDAALIGGQTYQVSTRIIPYSDRDTGWSAWGDGEVTLGLIGISGADLTPGSVDTGALADESVTTPKIDKKAISGSAKAAIRRQGASPPNYLFTKNSSGGETRTLMSMNINNETGAIVSLNYTFLNVAASWTRVAIGPGPQYAPASCTITLTIFRQNMPSGGKVKIASFVVDATKTGYKSKVPNVASASKTFKGAIKIGSSFHGTQKITLQAVVKGKTNSSIRASVWNGTMECSWQKR